MNNFNLSSQLNGALTKSRDAQASLENSDRLLQCPICIKKTRGLWARPRAELGVGAGGITRPARV